MPTMKELSVAYKASANAIHGRIVELRALERAASNPDEAFRLHIRISDLMPLWQEARELAKYTASYYGKECRNHEKG